MPEEPNELIYTLELRHTLYSLQARVLQPLNGSQHLRRSPQ